MKTKHIIIGTALTLIVGASHAIAQPVVVAELWGKHCVTCHGKEGKGDTKAGQRAKVKDMSSADYQKSFTDEKAFSSIKKGLKDGDRELMKPFHDKLTDEEIKTLLAYVRTFAPK